MLILQEMVIQGFRSFKEPQTFRFPRRPGLYFLAGRNEVEPRLGSNGAGKSSIWDALHWVFFGKTSRNLRAKAVANWDDEDLCKVSIKFSLKGEWLLTRTWSPNSLSLRNLKTDVAKAISQSALEDMINCDFDTFTRSVVVSQFGLSFMDLKPTDKLNAFSTMFHLDRWLDRSKKASALLKEASSARDDEDRERARLDGALDAREDELRSLEAQAQAAQAGQEGAVRDARRRYRQAARGADVAARRHRRYARALGRGRDGLDEAQRRLVAADDRLRGPVGRARDEATRRERDAIAKLLDHDEYDANLVSMKGGSCPTCSQNVGAESVEAILAVRERTVRVELLSEIEAARTALAKADRAYKKAKEARASTEAVFVQIEKRLDKVLAQERKAKAALDRERDKKTKAKAELDALRRQMDPNPFGKRIQEVQAEIDRLTRKSVGRQSLIEKYDVKIHGYDFWAREFKSLRLWIVKRMLLQFRVATNNNLQELGLSGWDVEFDVERTNASGDISRGFSAFVRSPGNEDPVPWEAWCGGETQRLKVATSLALADLVSVQRHFRCSVEVLDEPTRGMTQEGVEDLLRSLRDRALREKKVIWIVDHSTPTGVFDGTAMVRKTRNGSVIK